jgi:hypothetical protein
MNDTEPAKVLAGSIAALRAQLTRAAAAACDLNDYSNRVPQRYQPPPNRERLKVASPAHATVP